MYLQVNSLLAGATPAPDFTSDVGAFLSPSFSCDCNVNTTFRFSYKDCQDVKRLSGGRSGVYEISPVKDTDQLLSFMNAGTEQGEGF